MRVVVGVVVWPLEVGGPVIQPAYVLLGVLGAVAIDFGAGRDIPGVIERCVIVGPAVRKSITSRSDQAIVRPGLQYRKAVGREGVEENREFVK